MDMLVVLRGILTGFIVTLDDMSSFAVSAIGAMMEFITELVAVILGGDDDVSGVDCKKKSIWSKYFSKIA